MCQAFRGFPSLSIIPARRKYPRSTSTSESLKNDMWSGIELALFQRVFSFLVRSCSSSKVFAGLDDLQLVSRWSSPEFLDAHVTILSQSLVEAEKRSSLQTKPSNSLITSSRFILTSMWLDKSSKVSEEKPCWITWRCLPNSSVAPDAFDKGENSTLHFTVSYTHLTLPTSYAV